MDLRLALPAIAAWGAAGLVVANPRAGWWWCAVAAVLIGLAAAIAVFTRRRGSGTAIVVLVAVGVVAAATAVAGANRHPHALDELADGHRVTIDGTVTSTARASSAGGFGGDRVSFRMTATVVDVGSSRIAGRMPALVYSARHADGPRIGERIHLTGTLGTRDAADSVAFMVFSAEWRHSASPAPWLSWADGLRERFAHGSARLPGDGGTLLPGLAIGDESRVSAELDADMKSSSLSHLTAVSGSNCAVIVAGLLALAAAAGLPRAWRVGLALVGLAGFVVLVTPGASVLRAAVMASIVVLGTALGRPGRALPALSLAVFVLLVHDPWLARDYGFALSVLATGALLLLAPPLAVRLERWLPRWVAVGLSIPLAAQLACQPVLVLLNPTLPLYGVVANVLAEPAAPVGTVIGLIGCLVLPFCPPLASPLLWLAWAPSAWIAGIAHTTVALPGSALPWPGGVAGFALAVVLTGLVVAVVARPRTVRSRRVRTAVTGASVLALVVATAVQLGPAVAVRASMPHDWIVGMCDVGQGDAIVLHDGREYGLIDTGPSDERLTACLHRLHIGRLGLLVLTHYDLDHVGALGAVAGMTQLAVVGPGRDAGDARDIARLRTAGAEVHVGRRGDQGVLGGLRWTVLWPDASHPELDTSNERGIALQVEGRGTTMLFLADLDERAQDAMLSLGAPPALDVMKVAHHGTSDTSERLDEVTHPRLGLISCGAGNSYGHPAARALELLRASGAQIARTDLQGLVLVTARDGDLGLWTEKQATDRALWTPARR